MVSGTFFWNPLCSRNEVLLYLYYLNDEFFMEYILYKGNKEVEQNGD